MTKRFLNVSLIAVTLLLGNSVAMASGSYGGGRSYDTTPQVRQVDQTYETGKAIYKGRASSAGKLKYCVEVDNEIVPLKRKSLKPFKNASYNDVANKLYNCDSPETKIAEQLSKDEMLYVLYYLNKRFKLNLG